MIEIYFNTNGQAANYGYQISYRERGSGNPYSIYPYNIYASPAILTLPFSASGYEGYIAPQCTLGEAGTGVYWTTAT